MLFEKTTVSYNVKSATGILLGTISADGTGVKFCPGVGKTFTAAKLVTITDYMNGITFPELETGFPEM
jgi:hypothetical protein